MMTTQTIEDAAITGFATRYRGRPVGWAAQSWGVQQRWIQVTAYALNGSVRSGQEFRFRYIRDHYPNDNAVKDWLQISKADRDSWNAVFQAVRQVGDEARRAFLACTRTARAELEAA